MIVKCIEIRDRMTFIPACAISTAPENEGQRYLLRRAGYSPDGGTVVLVRLTDARSCNDAYAWGDRTMTSAHAYIEARFGDLRDGDVVDVEFIRGEKSAPVRSERGDVGGPL